MQAAGDLVRVVVELSARVQYGHDDLGGRPALFPMHVDGDAPAIVDHPDRFIAVDGDLDFRAVARERLVYRIVDGLEDHVVQSGPVVCVADVHSGPSAHGIQALEHCDIR